VVMGESQSGYIGNMMGEAPFFSPRTTLGRAGQQNHWVGAVVKQKWGEWKAWKTSYSPQRPKLKSNKSQIDNVALPARGGGKSWAHQPLPRTTRNQKHKLLQKRQIGVFFFIRKG